jgi:hypothetical protein
VGQTLTFEDYSPRDYYVRMNDGILRSILVNDVEFVDKKSPLI